MICLQYAVKSGNKCLRRFNSLLLRNEASSNVEGWHLRPDAILINSSLSKQQIHTSSVDMAWANEGLPKKWLLNNQKIFPPQSPDEEKRPAFVCHMKTNIKYSPWKMWYIACMVRGMSVDEAVKQLSFVLKKGGAVIKEAILEAQEMAVSKHNVEFKSNLWVAESFVGKGKVIKGVRRHARGRMGKVEYFHCHYFLRLEEGPPPKNYYQNVPKTGDEMLEDWISQMRQRRISSSL